MKNKQTTFKIFMLLFCFFISIQYAYSEEKISSEVKTSLAQLSGPHRQDNFVIEFKMVPTLTQLHSAAPFPPLVTLLPSH